MQGKTTTTWTHEMAAVEVEKPATFSRDTSKQGFESVFNQVSGSGSVFGIRIRIQEGKNDPHKKKKFRNFKF
jgi:hypothetical protein